MWSILCPPPPKNNFRLLNLYYNTVNSTGEFSWIRSALPCELHVGYVGAPWRVLNLLSSLNIEGQLKNLADMMIQAWHMLGWYIWHVMPKIKVKKLIYIPCQLDINHSDLLFIPKCKDSNFTKKLCQLETTLLKLFQVAKCHSAF